jgi:hypothetical protein
MCAKETPGSKEVLPLIADEKWMHIWPGAKIGAKIFSRQKHFSSKGGKTFRPLGYNYI